MAPVWYLASRKVERALKLKELPLLSLGAAFAFVIMMFNIPVPGGSSGHMAGSVVVAIVLGPWAAVVALTIALALQAFFFADGGVTALGANAFNMAFLMSFTGWFVFRALAMGDPGGGRRLFAAAVAGYVAVVIAALAAGIELGVQPVLAHDPAGMPLYAPYPLSVTMPAMLASHLLVFGPVEALGTALVVEYLYRTDAALVTGGGGDRGGGGGRGGIGGGGAVLRPLWAALIVLIMLTPLGLLAAAAPWGEWGTGEISKILGFVPEGMEGLAGRWRGVMPDYAFPGMQGPAGSVIGYVASAAVGSAVVVFIIYILGRLWRS
jgi:cobalt/nickel transport system permease protein